MPRDYNPHAALGEIEIKLDRLFKYSYIGSNN